MNFLDEAKKRRVQKWIDAGGMSSNYQKPECFNDIKTLKITLGPKVAHGQYIDLYCPKELEKIYLRKNLCLKILKYGGDTWGSSDVMGVSNLFESSTIQNLMADRGFAPKVFDIVKINGQLAQVTEYLTGEQTTNEIEDERFIFHVPEVTQPHNQIAGKLLDFQGARFVDYAKFKQDVIREATGKIQSKGASGGAYQSTSYFGGFRDTLSRISEYCFSGLVGKSVLDIGCNYGMFSREALRMGAKRVVGIDRPEVTKIARKLALIDGYFNIDFIGCDASKVTSEWLEENTGLTKFDVHFFLSMENWIGKPKYIYNCERIYWEGHGENRNFRMIDNPKP